ncbi:MAG: M23 family metallopeptidase [Cyclobacteriaceae bacterium]|nr:M23 family metallopeptidase [Cyclobacteriaceae bacterium]
MSRTKFYYNLKTLRYERTRFSVVRLIMGITGYLVFGLVFFAALLFLQNFIIDTPLEKQLRAENRALAEHKVVLTAQISESNRQLNELKQQDLLLYQKLFETQARNTGNNQVLPEREEILVSDADEFNESVTQLGNRFTELIQSARGGNHFFSLKASVGRPDMPALMATPSIAPIENFELEKLVSGYGMRINPFHKGKYHHDGVDIASPRGTAVLATAPGRVLITKRSELVAGYGNYIEVDHGNGYITRYSHLEEIEVRTGQKIEKGQRMGTVGSTGGSIAPHLHYEVIKNGVNLDPVKFFMEGISSDQYEILVNLSRKQNQSLD